MNRIFVSLLAVIFSISARGQMMDPVHFSSQLKMLGGDKGEIVFSATIDNGWHVYSTDLGNDGPVSATFTAVKMDGKTSTTGICNLAGQRVKDNYRGIVIVDGKKAVRK